MHTTLASGYILASIHSIIMDDTLVICIVVFVLHVLLSTLERVYSRVHNQHAATSRLPSPVSRPPGRDLPTRMRLCGLS